MRDVSPGAALDTPRPNHARGGARDNFLSAAVLGNMVARRVEALGGVPPDGLEPEFHGVMLATDDVG